MNAWRSWLFLVTMLVVGLAYGRATMRVEARPATTPTHHATGPLEHAVLGGGCFWCMEAVLDELKGVENVTCGYAGGHTANPTYEQVCSHTTGHAEVVQVDYDPKVLSYRDLLRVFFTVHDPTTADRQGNDVGSNYRSIILTSSPQQLATAKAVMADLTARHLFEQPITTQLMPLDHFWPAEEYHQHYFARHPDQPYCAFVVSPKVAKFRQEYADRLKR